MTAAAVVVLAAPLGPVVQRYQATPPPAAATNAVAAPVAHEAGVPDRIRIPAIGIGAPVDPVTAPDGVLRPPDDPDRVGWWSAGSLAGARHGAALLAGHSVSVGGGALDHLPDVRPGNLVELRLAAAAGSASRTVRYRVESVTSYDRDELARRAPALFRTDGPASLVIVTCVDFDGASYRGNLVVVARPVEQT